MANLAMWLFLKLRFHKNEDFANISWFGNKVFGKSAFLVAKFIIIKSRFYKI